ncbi:hypothetical protein H4R35_003412 [Dimargaris xerosporica]|nr:hypothetical protein H4R35_003412 [Dimargaris xerosporica]
MPRSPNTSLSTRLGQGRSAWQRLRASRSSNWSSEEKLTLARLVHRNMPQLTHDDQCWRNIVLVLRNNYGRNAEIAQVKQQLRDLKKWLDRIKLRQVDISAFSEDDRERYYLLDEIVERETMLQSTSSDGSLQGANTPGDRMLISQSGHPLSPPSRPHPGPQQHHSGCGNTTSRRLVRSWPGPAPEAGGGEQAPLLVSVGSSPPRLPSFQDLLASLKKPTIEQRLDVLERKVERILALLEDARLR